ncbi:MAG: hypothetical protein KGJ23_07850 [Euryarchaeota archaeon]|nr:hypothetical protein [Euryarchaeota archaeon]MDE1836513.1 hypothetical protein [Euryarchaeota archaeon]MDE1879292.1 hypothetical protein [Euryarchaeota archaeon]MDE2044483.1 hypothetical protein [Thermoplasmata archaeon]
MPETNDTAKEPTAKEQEQLPFICPRCGLGDRTEIATTKRGRFLKCHRCNWDSAKPEDFGTRPSYVAMAARAFKAAHPRFTLIRNLGFPANPVTKREADQRTRYDYSIWLGPHWLERIRFLTIRGTNFAQYVSGPEQYLLGDQAAAEYLSSTDRDALYGFFFPDATPKPMVALGEARKIQQYVREVKDRFGNTQYSIPVEARPLLLDDDIESQERTLLRRFGLAILEGQEIL